MDFVAALELEAKAWSAHDHVVALLLRGYTYTENVLELRGAALCREVAGPNAAQF